MKNTIRTIPGLSLLLCILVEVGLYYIEETGFIPAGTFLIATFGFVITLAGIAVILHLKERWIKNKKSKSPHPPPAV